MLLQQHGQGLPQNQRTPTKKAIIRKEEPARQARYGIMGPFGNPGALFGPKFGSQFIYWAPIWAPIYYLGPNLGPNL